MDAQHYVAGPVRKRPKRLMHMAVADDAQQPEKRVPGAFLDWAAKPSFSFDEIFLPLIIGKSKLIVIPRNASTFIAHSA